MPQKSARKLDLTPAQKKALERLANNGRGVRGRAASALFQVSSGASVKVAASHADRTAQTVYNWIRRFQSEGMGMFRERNHSTQGVPLSPDAISQVLELSRDTRQPRTAREIAEETGVSQATVCRLWKVHGVTPPRKQAFKNQSNAAPSHAEGEYVRLKDVAERAGVSVSTASVILRNLKGCSEATRDRVQQAAKELRYRPHPYLSVLMSQIHQNRYRGIEAAIAWMHGWPLSFEEACKLPFGPRRRFEAARKRALELGYRLEPFWIRDDSKSLAQHKRIWRHRGIFGALLDFPGGIKQRIVDALSDFALVGLSSFAESHIHIVQEDMYHDTIHLYARLWKLGYRRIGMCISQGAEQHQQFQSTAAFEFINNRMLPEKSRVPVLIPDMEVTQLVITMGLKNTSDIRNRLERELVENWLKRYRPEVVISNPVIHPYLENVSLKVPLDVGLAHRNLNSDVHHWTGISKNDEAIGKAGAELLASLVEKSETASNMQPRTVEFTGEWREGKTTRRLGRPCLEVSEEQVHWLMELARLPESNSQPEIPPGAPA